jgi:hypothetical protein
LRNSISETEGCGVTTGSVPVWAPEVVSVPTTGAGTVVVVVDTGGGGSLGILSFVAHEANVITSIAMKATKSFEPLCIQILLRN